MNGYLTRLGIVAAFLAVGWHVAARAQGADVANRMSIPDAEKGLDGRISVRARQLGHHGTVYLRVRIGADGQVSDISVERSSGSDLLDTGSLSAVRKIPFSPRKVGGIAQEFTVTIPVRFKSYEDMLVGGYSCRQANLDNDWFVQTFPTTPISQDEVFSFVQFMGRIVNPSLSGKRETGAFEAVWAKAVAACRSQPDTPFIKVLNAAKQ